MNWRPGQGTVSTSYFTLKLVQWPLTGKAVTKVTTLNSLKGGYYAAKSVQGGECAPGTPSPFHHQCKQCGACKIFSGITQVSAPTDSEFFWDLYELFCILMYTSIPTPLLLYCLIWDTLLLPCMHPLLFPDSLKHTDYPCMYYIWSSLYPIDSSILAPTYSYGTPLSFCYGSTNRSLLT